MQARASQIQACLRTVVEGTNLVVADVGAAKGLLPEFRPLEEDATLFLFEPEASAREKLVAEYARSGRTNIHVVAAAMAASTGKRTLHVTNKPSGSSLLPVRPDAQEYTRSSYFYPMREVEIETDTLKNVLAQAGQSRLDLIKIDVQGGELEVLQGLGDRAHTLLSAQVEVGMPGSYVGEPSFAELDGWMGKHGLVLFDLQPAHAYLTLDDDEHAYNTRVFDTFRSAPSIRRRIWQAEVFYFRDEDKVLASGDGAAVRRLVAAYAIHHFFAHAHRLADKAAKKNVLSDTAARSIQKALVGWHQATLDTSLRARTRRTLKRLAHRALSPEQATRLTARLRRR